MLGPGRAGGCPSSARLRVGTRPREAGHGGVVLQPIAAPSGSPPRCRAISCEYHYFWRSVMGKYLVGWVLGIPAVVLVIAYLFFN